MGRGSADIFLEGVGGWTFIMGGWGWIGVGVGIFWLGGGDWTFFRGSLGWVRVS